MNEKAIKFYQELKKTRNSKKITLKEISEYTKINPVYIEAIEEGNFSILPNVYMRLFLRSYAIYLEADSDKVLEDYELYTTGKIQTKTDVEVLDKKPTNKSSAKSSVNDKDIEISPKKIITIAAVFISIFLVFQLISTISEQQQSKSDTIKKENSETNQPMPIDDSDEIDSTYNSSSQSNNFSILPNLALLNNTDFDPLKQKAIL